VDSIEVECLIKKRMIMIADTKQRMAFNPSRNLLWCVYAEKKKKKKSTELRRIVYWTDPQVTGVKGATMLLLLLLLYDSRPATKRRDVATDVICIWSMLCGSNWPACNKFRSH